MNLSDRLNTILELIEPTDVLVDVGTDHGYVSIQAIIDNKCKKAYGLDIASGPLSYANRNILEAGLEDKIQTYQLDGLKGFNDKADAFVIAGMGFETIISIIEHYPFDPSQQIILQSNTKQYDFRKALSKLGFKIIDERFLFDNNKPVTILKVMKESFTLSEEDAFLGPILKNTNNQDYIKYLSHEYDKLKHVVNYNKNYEERFTILINYLAKKGVTL